MDELTLEGLKDHLDKRLDDAHDERVQIANKINELIEAMRRGFPAGTKIIPLNIRVRKVSGS